MCSCKTCWFNITDYDERDRVYHYCHLTLEPINENKKDCKEYKPHDKKRYIERQFKRIMENLSTAEGIVEHWLETINDKEYEEQYALIRDSRNRLEWIKHYQR